MYNIIMMMHYVVVTLMIDDGIINNGTKHHNNSLVNLLESDIDDVDIDCYVKITRSKKFQKNRHKKNKKT